MSHVPKIPRRGPADGEAAPPDDAEAAPADPVSPPPLPTGEAGAAAGPLPPDWAPPGGLPPGALPPDLVVRPAREPVFMLPGSVVVMIALLAGIQLVRSFLNLPQDIEVLAWFAFIPARFATVYTGLPGGVAADVWTFVSYALLHGSWMHLITNSVWLVAFGTAVARRFGALRFWLFAAATAAAGAAVHLALHPDEMVPVVGASAAIAGMMAAAARFVFDAGGPLAFRRGVDPAAYRLPARSLVAALSNRTALFFIGIFILMNLFIGVGGSLGAGEAIAWEAHLGGFAFGLLAFRLFDPVRG